MTTAEALAANYNPADSVRVGILLIAGAFRGEQAVDDALRGAGHTPLRRRADLQPRVGETVVRVEDVLEFLALYGHEYALVAFRSWPEGAAHREELLTAAHAVGCRTIWESPVSQ